MTRMNAWECQKTLLRTEHGTRVTLKERLLERGLV
jgi:hypothetical protein